MRGEGHMRTKAEMGVMQPEAEESREPQKLEEARTGDGRECSPGDALTLGSWLPELPRGLKSLILSFFETFVEIKLQYAGMLFL